MGFPCLSLNNLIYASLLLLSVVTLLSPSLAISPFSPVDDYRVNCGSSLDSLEEDNRLFVGDAASSSRFLSSTRSTVQLTDENPAPSTPGIYRTARAFSKPSKYVFHVRDRGVHVVRLHFHLFNSSVIVRNDVEFHVLVGGYVVLSNFTGLGAVVKDFLIWVDKEKVVVNFLPTKWGKIGFVNAIEFISSPKDLILESAQYIYRGKVVNFEGLNRQALEVVHRVNVGGPKVTPFNDSLWRTWIPDDEFFISSSISEKVFFSGRINYQQGGASREVGPDNVYNSARVIRSTNASVPNVTMTWVFPVIGGHDYLVRLHFCDIASISLGLIFFNVYVNGVLVYQNFDLSYVANEVLASPFYADFVVDGDGLQLLTISIRPSNYSLPHAVDGILNGIEVMKLNNSFGSLDGEVCSSVILKSWPRGNIIVLVLLVVGICLLLSISIILHGRTMKASNTVSWTKLPMDGREVFEKQATTQIAEL